MWKAYKYIYYWLYTWQKKLWGKNDLPEYNAALGMSLSFFCNCCSLVAIIYIVKDVMVIPLDLPKQIVLIPIFAVMLLHYFLLVHNGKYLQIEKEFKKESKKERKRKGVWVLLYAFGSLAFFIFLLFFGIWLKH